MKKISAAAFRKYGRVIRHPKSTAGKRGRNLFCVVLRERRPLGWRIACLVVREKKVTRLEQHPESFESFEPVQGRSVLYVCTEKERSQIECFELTEPVVLHKGVWHAIACIGKQSELKICENAKVACRYWTP